ncbi:redoxin domain-containing protein [Pedobacter miscanthi]|nr:redoxin domain-containing protein [Pedobacter miscanthi]
MKAIFFNLLLSIYAHSVMAQGIQVKAGDQFPDILIKNLINSPVKFIQFGQKQDNKIYILNLWGTWCSPCIPEMDTLAKLQMHNPASIQVIGISDEKPSRLINYLVKKPSKVWLCSDTSGFFYKLFAFAYVGQSAIVDAKGKVVALVKSDLINQKMIDRLVKGLAVKSTAEFKEKPVNSSDDIFAVDSTQIHSFSLRGYIKGQHSGSKRYTDKSVFDGRRISFTNATIASLYKDAYGVVSEKQLIYELPEKEVSDFDHKETLYSLDLLVRPEERDSLMMILQKKLLLLLPVKVRVEYRVMPVYTLINKNFTQKESVDEKLSYGFSGEGYDGQGATLANFANDYLSNEFSLPVVDETGLTKRYNIKTEVAMRNKEGILKSINDIGLDIVKQDRRIKVLVFYK